MKLPDRSCPDWRVVDLVLDERLADALHDAALDLARARSSG
jgi:hypothetical protein